MATASAQNRNEEYREWQRAQIKVQRQQQQYNRTRSQRDYREWQQAQRQAQQEYNEYVRSNNNRNNNYDGYNNNGNYNHNNGGRRYRVYRDGSYYSTDQRGAELLRSAINSGYSQGYRQGQIDRQSRRGSNYGGSTVYRSGNYGYQSYVERNQYQHYFQQGFQRGYGGRF